MLLKFIRTCFERDRALLRNIQRRVVYPMYRWEFMRLAAARERMGAFSFLEKGEMMDGEWKWVYVIKE